MPNKQIIFQTGSTLPCGDYPNLSITPPPESATPQGGTTERGTAKSRAPNKKGMIYIYIDQSNLWIGGKQTLKKDWAYDAGNLLSLLIRETAIGKELEKNDYGTKVRVYGRFPDAVKEKWQSQGAIFDKRRGPTLTDDDKDKREKEVDTALVAHSVRDACEGYKHPDVRREFVIVSGDRDMRPAVEIIYGGEYPSPVRVWAWKEAVSNVYKDLNRRWKPVTLHFLDDHLDCIREKRKKPSEEEETQDDGFQLVSPSPRKRTKMG